MPSPDSNLVAGVPTGESGALELPSGEKSVTQSCDEFPDALVPLRRLLNRSQRFSLAFVVCNGLVEERRLLELAATILPAGRKVRRVEAATTAQELIDRILNDTAADQPGDAVFVSGLETLVPSHDPHPALLTLLNQLRERFRKLNVSVVFWVSDFVLTRIAREAPDFWAWRSGVFDVEFAADQLHRVTFHTLDSTRDANNFANLPLAEKEELYEVLRGLWAELAKPRTQDRQHTAGLALRLGILATFLGRPQEARTWLAEAITAHESLGDQRGLSASLRQLAMIESAQGNLSEARRLIQRSLAIDESLGDQRGLSASLHQLAMIESDQANPREARRLLQRSLAINESLGNQRGVSASLHQLAMIESAQGNPREARRLLQRSLAIKGSLGDQHGLAASLHMLAIIESAQGNPSEARRLLQRSLAINESLGNQRGLSASLHQLANIEMTAGNRDQARQLWERSIRMDESIGDVAGAAATKSDLAQLEAIEGRFDRAIDLASAAVQQLEQLGYAQAEQAREVLRLIEQFAAQGSRPAASLRDTRPG